MKKESSGAGTTLMKTKSSGAGVGAMFMKHKSSGAGAVSFLRRLRSLGQSNGKVVGCAFKNSVSAALHNSQ